MKRNVLTVDNVMGEKNHRNLGDEKFYRYQAFSLRKQKRLLDIEEYGVFLKFVQLIKTAIEFVWK